MKNLVFQIYGSESSKCYDVMVFVNKLPPKDYKKIYYKIHKDIYYTFIDNFYPIKDVKINLAILKDGVIVKVFKGLNDEMNNSLYYTYHLHKQFFDQQIKQPVKRNIHAKIIDTVNYILTGLHTNNNIYSYTINLIKLPPIEKLNYLKSINLSDFFDITNKQPTNWLVEYVKNAIFQITQTLSLIDGIELYTKEELSNKYPDVSDMLHRKTINLTTLEKYKIEFIKKSQHFLMKKI